MILSFVMYACANIRWIPLLIPVLMYGIHVKSLSVSQLALHVLSICKYAFISANKPCNRFLIHNYRHN